LYTLIKTDENRMKNKQKAAHILIVDDDRSIRQILQKAFEKEGLECSAASGGEQALAIMQAKEFDVIITDLHMPGLDGIGLLKQINAQYDADVREPVILSTSHCGHRN